MVAEVYADVLFAVNFIMNCIVFYIAGKIMRKKTRRLRTGVGAAFCALVYAVIIFIIPFQLASNTVTAMIILASGVLIVFWPAKGQGRQIIYLIIAAWTSAFLLGGTAFGLYHLVSSPNSLIAFGMNSREGSAFSLAFLLVSSACVYAIIKIILGRVQKSHIHKQQFYDYRIWLNDAKAEIKGLVDTGNCLREPLSKSPVVVAEATVLRAVLPEAINDLFAEKRENDMQLVIDEFTQSGMSARIRFIPYTAADGATRTFIGFRPDKIEIETTGGSITVNNVIIGICNFKLSPGGDYNSLLNPAILN